MQVCLMRDQPFMQEREVQLQTEKLMALSRIPSRRQRRAPAHKKTDRVRRELHSLPATCHPPGSLHVETDFDAFGVKAIRPIQRLHRDPFVPFETKPGVLKAARHLAP